MTEAPSDQPSDDASDDAPLIIVVDDEPDWRLVLSKQLQVAGYRVLAFEHPVPAFDAIVAHQPVAVTCDVMMPHVDGWSLAAGVKADPRTAHIPVVMVTSTEDQRLVPYIGVTGFLTKPVEQDVLADTLAGLSPTTARSRRVLAVDDDPMMRRLLTIRLERAGWEPILAADGVEALERLDDGPFALVLLDLQMPNLDGFGFMEATRGDPRLESTPIVVLTAKDLTGRERERLDGVTRFRHKGPPEGTDLTVDGVVDLIGVLATASPPPD